MPGKMRPSLRAKTLLNVRASKLSVADKNCILYVFKAFEEVVRCKDCKYWQDNNGGYPHEDCRWGKNETPDADDFCSYGERKDDK